MNRIFSLCIVGCLSFLSVKQAAAEPAQNKFNVLFIAIDDLRPELGCYGIKDAQSPNLDRLAKQGCLFTRHYVQVATCGASRYALLTGRSPAASGVTRSNAGLYAGASALKQTQTAGAQSLPELFRRSGYVTSCIGKISHTADGRVYAYNGQGDGRDEVPHAWDHLPTPFGPWKRGWGIFFAYEGGKHREDGGGHKDLMEFTAENDSDLPDGMLADTAIEQLKEFKKGDKPFFMGLGFFKPHLPFVATKQDWDAFEGVDIDIAADAVKPESYWHGSGEFYKYSTPYKKTNPLSPDAHRMARRAYLACVRYSDRQVGRVLKALDDLDMADNTVVVVWGDHGWHLGEQQIWAKHTPLERANRSVLMVRAPGMEAAGVKTDTLVETIDLYPTLIELCAPKFQQTEHALDGRSFAALLQGKPYEDAKSAISYWGDAISVRNNTHRLIVKHKNGKVTQTDLYDLSNDQDNTTNIAAENPEIVQQMMKQVKLKK
ncbi:MAG: iduronate sulfatase [Blastopirellula sp.]|nr:MAG: iduronate sulfatase [Blastopirellula sp.]